MNTLKQGRKLDTAEMEMIRWLCGATKLDKVRNNIRQKQKGRSDIEEDAKKISVVCSCEERRRRIMHRNRVMKVQGERTRFRPKRRWMGCIRDDRREKQLSVEGEHDRAKWRQAVRNTSPRLSGKRCIEKEEEEKLKH